ncbi:hypothetical protein KPL74_11665 [Bacillus sp. NP157]|nr:hypothetical protein KPL74_11665 [Bacillus sp. NP157]
MASFLLNGQDWPTDPYPFKLTNLVIHVANALLLGMLLLRLERRLGSPAPIASRSAWLGAALWSLHPFLVSTVLYVVQREAMLAATCAFLALHAWLTARDAFSQPGRRGIAWLYFGFGGAVLAGLGCKANAAVIPLLALAIDGVLPTPPSVAALAYRRHRFVVLVLPAAALILGLLWMALPPSSGTVLPERGWSIGQRLLTEPRVIGDYLARLWFVQSPGGAFFHDQLTASRSLLDPWQTAACIALCAALIAVAFVVRRRAPALSIAILFYFAGHLLESTSVPLELYFEHRNYLPAALMFWPLARVVSRIPYAWARLVIPALMAAFLAVATWLQASLWADPLAQAEVWASLQPGSARAQANAISTELSSGRLGRALLRADAASAAFPNEPQIAINRLDAHCAAGAATSHDVDFAATAFRTALRDPGSLTTHYIESAIAALQTSHCAALDAPAIGKLIEALGMNPKARALPGRRQDVVHLRGALALRQGDVATAESRFAEALAEDPSPRVALNEAALLGRAGQPGAGLRLLDRFDRMPPPKPLRPRDGIAWVRERTFVAQGFWTGELQAMRRSLRAAQETGGTGITPGVTLK